MADHREVARPAEGRYLRRASVADWPSLWPIWHQVVAAGDTYCYDPATTSGQAREKWLGAPTSEVWMERDLRVVTGMYWLGPNQAGPGAHIANASYMVAADGRGRGVGRRLVLHSLDRARERGFRGLQFNAVAASNVWAIKLYADLGFAVVGTVPDGFRHPREGLVDLLIMYRSL